MKRISTPASAAFINSVCAALAAVPVNDAASMNGAAQLERKAGTNGKSITMNAILTRQHQNQTGAAMSQARIEMPIEWIGVDQKAELANPRGDAA